MYGIGHKQKLWEELSRRGRMTWNEVIEFARLDNWHKESEIERRMRPSESPCVKAMTRADGSIESYEWICVAPFKAESRSDKQKREAYEKEDSILAAMRRDAQKAMV